MRQASFPSVNDTQTHTHTHTRSCQSSSLTMERKYKTPWGVERRVGTDDALCVCVCARFRATAAYTQRMAHTTRRDGAKRSDHHQKRRRTDIGSLPLPLSYPYRWGVVLREVNRYTKDKRIDRVLPGAKIQIKFFFEFQHFWRQFFFFSNKWTKNVETRFSSAQEPPPPPDVQQTHTQRFVELFP